jgi:DinB superfamily
MPRSKLFRQQKGETIVASANTLFRSTILAALATAAALTAQAQSPAAPSAPSTASAPEKDILRSYNGLKTNILKSADKMPAEGYSFKPEPDIRTFARILNHVTEAQLHSCGALNGTAPDALPAVPPETADKTAIVAALQASFAECDKAYTALSSENLMESVSMGKMTRSRVSVAWGNVAHDDEQYASLALYMRLKGIAPPSTEK